MDTLTITHAPVTVDDLAAVVDGAAVALTAAVCDRIAASRAVVERALAAGDAVYGLTTHVGRDRDVRLTAEQVRNEQMFLVMSHAGGFGPPLPTEIVRAALLVRLTGIARGGSGASQAAADTLVGMLNAGVHPVVPSTASVGAGDIGHMATMAQVAIGAGRAEHEGEIMAGGEALRRAGIAPLPLSGRDGLALISANGVSVGHAALVAARARRVADAADQAAALSLEAVAGNPSIVRAAVGRAKPIAGQIAAADHLRNLLDGSDLWDTDVQRSVQDPLSFRVVPQVHGALREHVTAVVRAVETELNAAADNPLVAIDDQALVSNGNFHPIVLAISCDALRVAVAHVGRLSERRMEHLWAAALDGITAPPAGPLFGLALRYPAAAAVSELRQLSAPATLDVPTLERGVEDHGTDAPLTVRQTERALDLLEDVLAAEVLLANDTLAIADAARTLGSGTTALRRTITDALAAAAPAPDAVHAALRARFPSGLPSGPTGPPNMPEL